MKILVIALSGIGDALMFTPAVELLKKLAPDSEIDALVMYRGSEEIYSANSNFNKVIFFDFINKGFTESVKFLLKLRKKYDVSVNVYPANRKEYNIISFLVGARKRAAVKYIRKNFINLGFLNNITVAEDDFVHNVETNIKLVEALLETKINEKPDLKYVITQEDEKFADNFYLAHHIGSNDPVIGFHPGCSTLKNHDKRRWEINKFAQLGRLLIEKHYAKILIFGGPDENELKEKLYNLLSSNRVFIVDTPDLNKSSAIMKRCHVFVTNDSSQMHIAAANKLRVVAIIGPTNPHYIRPWNTGHEIVSLNLECSPCFFYSPRPLICSRNDVKFKCIKEVDVDRVYDAVRKFL